MLTPPDRAHWQKLKEILADALEQSSIKRRAETVRQACAHDPGLLQDAEALLSQDTTAFEHFAEFAATALRNDLPSRVGERLGAYAITREIGRGGMGAVYLAQRADGEFEKQVAIKILKRGTDTEDVLRRFRAERQILANLENSHITRLLDAGITADGLPYVVMEFVAGRPITDFVREEKCSLRQRLQLFLKVCSAVDLAHKQGVIHRDIKPSNILVKSDDEVKLLDFGIAKLIAGERNDVTVASERRLTPRYAAPEQSTNEFPTVATDIYSLGILLSDLVEELREPDRGGAAATTCLKKVVKRATQADPQKRHPSAQALAHSVEDCVRHSRVPRASSLLRGRPFLLSIGAVILLLAILSGALWWQRRSSISKEASSSSPPAEAAVSNEIHSIAILPFNQLPRDRDDLLGLGMADAIIGRLSGLKQLIVLPTAAVSRFREPAEDAIAAGNKLNVDAVLSGTIQRAQEHIRVTVQLVNVGSRRTLWADTFDQTSTDIFAIQDSISERVAHSLLANLSETDLQQLEKRYTGDTAAYKSYLRGVLSYNLRTKEGLQEAIDYFQQAIASDPHYALAYALMSDSYHLLSYYNYEPASLTTPNARATAEKALALDSSLPEAHLAISNLQRNDSPDSPGIQSLLRAIHLNPNYALAHQRYAWFLCANGQVEQAVQEMSKAQTLDPLSGANNTALGIVYLFARRYPQALYYCERAAALNPNEPYIWANLAGAYVQNRKYDEAITALRKVEEVEPKAHGNVLAQIASVLIYAGRPEEAERLMPELLELVKQNKIDAYHLAILYVARGETGKALYWLNQPKSPGLSSPGLLQYDPRLDPIRSDARFQALIEKSKLEAQHKNAG